MRIHGWRKHLLTSVLSLSILVGMAGGYVLWRRDPLAGAKPNILILSFCSLRPQDLKIYNPAAEPLPALDRFFADSVVFDNAINGLPWTNVTNYISPADLRAWGYSNAKRKSLRIPIVPIHKAVPANELNEDLDFNDPQVRNYELNYGDGFKALKKAITTTTARPFFYSVHIKYMHFPVIDEVNQKDLWREKFSPQAARMLETYLAAPEKYPAKAALLLTLFADPAMVRTNPFVTKYTGGQEKVRIGQIYQILSDAELLAAWKASENYQTDLQILREGYRLKLRNLDQQLAEVLDLFGDRKLQNSTIVAVTGDHGESFMEDGHFLHSNDIREAQIRFPFAIRAAGGGKRARIEEQYSMDLQNSLLSYVSLSNAEPAVIRDFVAERGEIVYLRNCQGDAEGIRMRNKYKLVSDITGYHLHDVTVDPAQMTDLKLVQPEMFFKLKDMLLSIKSIPRDLLACDVDGERGKPLHDKPRRTQ